MALTKVGPMRWLAAVKNTTVSVHRTDVATPAAGPTEVSKLPSIGEGDCKGELPRQEACATQGTSCTTLPAVYAPTRSRGAVVRTVSYVHARR